MNKYITEFGGTTFLVLVVGIAACLIKGFVWSGIWIYPVGCLGGGLLAGLVFNLINPDDKQEAQM